MRSLGPFALLGVLLGTLTLLGPLPAAQAGEPCCSVVAVDATNCAVTLKDAKTGRTFQVAVLDKAWLKTLKVGKAVDIAKAQPTGSTGSAASSGTTATTSGAGSSSCGSNVPRGADTRPKECVATNSAGQQVRVVCPPGR